MELYMDEKWKLSKNKSSRNSGSRQESAAATSDGAGGAFLKRSSSVPAARAASSSGGPPSFTSRCTNVVKEQRSRFYIMRRCVKMLICWRDYP